MTSNDTEKLGELIVDLANKQWETSQKPLLLSALGPMLTKSGFQFREIIAPLKLSQFISFSLSENLSIVEHPEMPEKIGITPLGVKYSFEKVGSQASVTSSRSSVLGRRIKPSLWAAFVKPVSSGQKRFLDPTEDRFHFRDVDMSESPQAKEVEIATSYVVDGGAPDYDPTKTMSSIVEFCKVNAIDLERIYISKTEKERKEFFDFFDGLSQEDLRKIQIPFEVLFRICKK